MSFRSCFSTTVGTRLRPRGISQTDHKVSTQVRESVVFKRIIGFRSDAIRRCQIFLRMRALFFSQVVEIRESGTPSMREIRSPCRLWIARQRAFSARPCFNGRLAKSRSRHKDFKFSSAEITRPLLGVLRVRSDHRAWRYRRPILGQRQYLGEAAA
jgi:hypothetical protein